MSFSMASSLAIKAGYPGCEQEEVTEKSLLESVNGGETGTDENMEEEEGSPLREDLCIMEFHDSWEAAMWPSSVWEEELWPTETESSVQDWDPF